MTARARWLALYALLLGLNVSKLSADEPKPAMRPISDAESVLAVYRQDWGLASSGKPAIILAAWPDGLIVWSDDRLRGGPPYRAGHVDPRRVKALLTAFDQDGLFADERLNDGHFGPDSQFTTVFVKSGKKQVEMRSWHELYEEGGGLVVDHHGVSFLDGRHKLDVLRKAPADYLFFRLVWSETRSKLAELMPGESTVTGGKPVMRAGKLSWQEASATSTDRR
jgi:hypothetical protein